MSMSHVPTQTSATARLPLDVFSNLCDLLSGTQKSSLAVLSRTASDIHDIALPHLYRQIHLDSDNINVFLLRAGPSVSKTAGSFRLGLPPTAYTTRLHIASVPDDSQQTTSPYPTSESTKLFPNVHTLTLGSHAVWQMIVYAHTHSTSHPLIDFLRVHANPRHLVIHYPHSERTSHSFGGGFCCCMAAVRAFQRNPLRAAAYDTSSTAALISTLTDKWSLEGIRMIGVVDDQVPLGLKALKVEVEWAGCQCTDKDFHGEWCFNHVTPCKRVRQIKELTSWGKEKGADVEMAGIENVSCIDKLGTGMRKWILDQVEREETECPSFQMR